MCGLCITYNRRQRLLLGVPEASVYTLYERGCGDSPEEGPRYVRDDKPRYIMRKRPIAP